MMINFSTYTKTLVFLTLFLLSFSLSAQSDTPSKEIQKKKVELPTTTTQQKPTTDLSQIVALPSSEKTPYRNRAKGKKILVKREAYNAASAEKRAKIDADKRYKIVD